MTPDHPGNGGEPQVQNRSSHCQSAHTNALIIVVAYTVFGLTLLFQGSRYIGTPAYGILIDMFSLPVWAALYLAVALGLAVSVRYSGSRALAVITRTVALALTGVWLGGFVVRYVSDPHTTIVNVVSWSVFFALLVRSSLSLDDPTP